MNNASIPEVSPARAVSQPLTPKQCSGCGVPLIGREIQAGICFVCVQEQVRALVAKMMAQAVGR